MKLKENRVKNEKLDQLESSKDHLLHAERAYLELAKKYASSTACPAAGLSTSLPVAVSEHPG